MCIGDVGVVTFDWVEGLPNPYPDFNTWHQCRDFEKIFAWFDEHAVPARVEVNGVVPLKEAP